MAKIFPLAGRNYNMLRYDAPKLRYPIKIIYNVKTHRRQPLSPSNICYSREFPLHIYRINVISEQLIKIEIAFMFQMNLSRTINSFNQ